MKTLLLTLMLLLTACAQVPPAPTAAEVAALAPTGKLRVGVYVGNPLSVVRDPVSQEMRGVGYELGRDLAKRLGVPFEPVVHPGVSAVLGNLSGGSWDIAVLVVTPDRAKQVDFTIPFADIELGYLVPAGSQLKNAADVDAAQIRIAAQAKGGAEVLLSRTLKSSKVIPASGLAGVVELVKSGKADAAAANKPILYEISSQLPGSRILEGRFSAEHAAFAVPKGREAAVAYVNRFIESAKASGRLQAVIDDAGARGAVVPAPGTSSR